VTHAKSITSEQLVEALATGRFDSTMISNSSSLDNKISSWTFSFQTSDDLVSSDCGVQMLNSFEMVPGFAIVSVKGVSAYSGFCKSFSTRFTFVVDSLSNAFSILLRVKARHSTQSRFIDVC